MFRPWRRHGRRIRLPCTCRNAAAPSCSSTGRGAAEETSLATRGLIQREGIVPYGFPRDVNMLWRYLR